MGQSGAFQMQTREYARGRNSAPAMESIIFHVRAIPIPALSAAQEPSLTRKVDVLGPPAILQQKILKIRDPWSQTQ